MRRATAQLTDGEWARLAPLLPWPQTGPLGSPAPRQRRLIPQLETEKTPRLMDGLYRECNAIEWLVGRPREHGKLTTRRDKLATRRLAFRVVLRGGGAHELRQRRDDGRVRDGEAAADVVEEGPTELAAGLHQAQKGVA
jgi:hypothetical protein